MVLITFVKKKYEIALFQHGNPIIILPLSIMHALGNKVIDPPAVVFAPVFTTSPAAIIGTTGVLQPDCSVTVFIGYRTPAGPHYTIITRGCSGD